MVIRWIKYAAEVLDYQIDFAALLDPSDTIVGDPVITAPAGIIADQVRVSGSTVRFWMTGGTSCLSEVSCLISTVSGRTLEAQVPLQVLP